MADNTLPSEHLQTPSDEAAKAIAERRAFLKRAALVGLPVLIATVPGRTVWAKQGDTAGTLAATCGASMGCASATSETQNII